jgi:hypothetical protein
VRDTNLAHRSSVTILWRDGRGWSRSAPARATIEAVMDAPTPTGRRDLRWFVESPRATAVAALCLLVPQVLVGAAMLSGYAWMALELFPVVVAILAILVATAFVRRHGDWHHPVLRAGFGAEVAATVTGFLMPAPAAAIAGWELVSLAMATLLGLSLRTTLLAEREARRRRRR